jgi:hypothetical protein
MLAHVHGELLNWSELGRSLGVSDATVRRYVDVLEGTYMVRQLRPWHENISKRQVKAPKLYFRDSGLLHLQLGLRSHADLLVHPRLGASWEGFGMKGHPSIKGVADGGRTRHGAGLDLPWPRQGRIRVAENFLPSLTPSMRSAAGGSKARSPHVSTQTNTLVGRDDGAAAGALRHWSLTLVRPQVVQCSSTHGQNSFGRSLSR